jgi:hypothetical protein
MDRIKAHRIFSVFITIRVAFEKRLAHLCAFLQSKSLQSIYLVVTTDELMTLRTTLNTDERRGQLEGVCGSCRQSGMMAEASQNLIVPLLALPGARRSRRPEDQRGAASV